MGSAIDNLQAGVQRWFDDGAIAFSMTSLSTGPWLTMVDAYLMPLFLSSGGPIVHEFAPALELDVSGATPRLRDLNEFPENAEVAVLPTQRSQVPIKTAIALYRKKVRDCWMLETDGWKCLPVESLLIELLLNRRVKPFLNRLVPNLWFNDGKVVTQMSRRVGVKRGREATSFGDPETAVIGGPKPYEKTVSMPTTGESLWEFAIERDNESLGESECSSTDEKLKVVQYIGSLSSGGAERQLCNLAVGLHQRGHDCRVITTYEARGDLGHYRHILESAGARVQVASGKRPDGAFSGAAHDDLSSDIAGRIKWHLIAAAPVQLQPFITDLALELAAEMPDVLHCWLDHPNIMGAMAGIIAGVPRILLSTRNSNPTNFPRLFSPYLETWYRILSKSNRIHWLANSHSGAESYAQWLGMDVDQTHVVLNGLFADHFERPTREQRQAAREQFGLAADAPVIAVVNRLSEEKQPDLMLKVVSLLKAEMPGFKVLVAGTGPLEESMREIIRRRKLEGCVNLVGRVKDVNQIFCASDLLLLTSTLEGCPNVALEAQHFGLPVVATRGGGTVDAVVHEVTGIMCGVHDAVEIAQALRRVLSDETVRERMGRAGQQFVDQCFAVDQMVDLTQCVYRLMLDGNPEHKRVVTPSPIHGFCFNQKPAASIENPEHPDEATLTQNGSTSTNGHASVEAPIVEIVPTQQQQHRNGKSKSNGKHAAPAPSSMTVAASSSTTEEERQDQVPS